MGGGLVLYSNVVKDDSYDYAELFEQLKKNNIKDGILSWVWTGDKNKKKLGFVFGVEKDNWLKVKLVTDFSTFETKDEVHSLHGEPVSNDELKKIVKNQRTKEMLEKAGKLLSGWPWLVLFGSSAVSLYNFIQSRNIVGIVASAIGVVICFLRGLWEYASVSM